MKLRALARTATVRPDPTIDNSNWPTGPKYKAERLQHCKNFVHRSPTESFRLWPF